MRKENNDSKKNPVKEVNKDNYEYLSNQVLFSGFGTSMDEAIYKMMQKGEEKSIIPLPIDPSGNIVEANLHFSQSDQGYYFLNKFDLTIPDQKVPGEVLKNTFYINNKGYHEGKNLNYTFKEAFNLLSGRPVFKTKLTKEETPYEGWGLMNFNDRDKYGNYPIVTYGERYGFNLDRQLANISNLLAHKDEHEMAMLKDGLHRGNRQYTKETVNGVGEPRYLEVNIKERQVDIYDKEGNLLGNSKDLGKAQREAQRADREQTQSKTKKESKAQYQRSRKGAKMRT